MTSTICQCDYPALLKYRKRHEGKRRKGKKKAMGRRCDLWMTWQNSVIYLRGCVTCMGWLRLVGSLKSEVSLAEYSLFYRALLQKRPIIWRSLLIVVTPYVYMYRERTRGIAGVIYESHRSIQQCARGGVSCRVCVCMCVCLSMLDMRSNAYVYTGVYTQYFNVVVCNTPQSHTMSRLLEIIGLFCKRAL